MNDYQQQLSEFINSKDRRDWLFFPLMKVYVRKGTHLVDRLMVKTLDIANVEVDEGSQDRGVFTQFLTAAEQVATQAGLALYIENILTNRFENFFRKRGYQMFHRTDGDKLAVKLIK